MKKIFTLIAAAMVAVAANAQKFNWNNAEGTDEYVATAGTIECLGGDNPGRLNYANAALGVTYKTICLNGKAANLGDGSASGTYMMVTFATPLAEGDVISMTAYRNKDASGKPANAEIKFSNDAVIVMGGEDGFGFVNLNAAGDTPEATAPNTLTYTVTAAEAGATSMTMTRSKASTNLFITALVVSSPDAVEAAKADEAPAKAAPKKVLTSKGIMIGNTNVAGQRVK